MLVGCMSLVNSSTHFRCLSLQSCVKTEEIEEKLAEEIADNLSAPHLAQARECHWIGVTGRQDRCVAARVGNIQLDGRADKASQMSKGQSYCDCREFNVSTFVYLSVWIDGQSKAIAPKKYVNAILINY